MTVFPDGTKERLHGHNYFLALRLDLSDVSFAKLLPFGVIKKELGALCQEWKERTLLAVENPFYELVSDDGKEIEFRLCGARYVLPREDVLLLPVDNISVESLSFHLAQELAHRLAPIMGEVVTGLELDVSEVPGQGASAYLELPLQAKGTN